jgi:ABC-type Fe3+ transport system permease subunit
MNNKQKRTLISGLLIIAAAFFIWAVFGGDIFTKNEVLIEKQDKLLGTSYKEWEDKFVLGLDYTLAFSFITSIITAVIIFFQRQSKN